MLETIYIEAVYRFVNDLSACRWAIEILNHDEKLDPCLLSAVLKAGLFHLKYSVEAVTFDSLLWTGFGHISNHSWVSVNGYSFYEERRSHS